MSPSQSPQALGWSADRVATLTILWSDGLTAAQIAQRLGGVTRSAVLGKVHRLGLSGRAAPSSPRLAPRAARPQRLRQAQAPRPAKVNLLTVSPAPVATDEPGLVGTLVGLGVHACKWPIGDPKSPTFSFCGRHADDRYCAAHGARAVRRGAAWRPEMDPVVKRALAGLV